MSGPRWLSLCVVAVAPCCVYEGRDDGARPSFPPDSTEAGPRVTPYSTWDSGSADAPDSGADTTVADAPEPDAGTDAPAWPPAELVVAGDAYQVAVRGDALAAYVGVLVGGSIDTQLQLREASGVRVLHSGTQVLARNAIALDDDAVAASSRDGVFAYPRVAGPRVDVAFGTVPQGVQLAGLTAGFVYYQRPSPTPGGLDELRRRSRVDATDEVVACSVSTSAVAVASDGSAVLGRPGGVVRVALAALPGACSSETAGTVLSAAASPVSVLVGSVRVVIGQDIGAATSLTAVSLAGGAPEPVGTAAIGLWGTEPARPLAELGDTLFYVEETGAENYVVEHPPAGTARRLAPVARRAVRAVAASSSHVYFSTVDGISRVAR